MVYIWCYSLTTGYEYRRYRNLNIFMLHFVFSLERWMQNTALGTVVRVAIALLRTLPRICIKSLNYAVFSVWHNYIKLSAYSNILCQFKQDFTNRWKENDRVIRRPFSIQLHAAYDSLHKRLRQYKKQPIYVFFIFLLFWEEYKDIQTSSDPSPFRVGTFYKVGKYWLLWVWDAKCINQLTVGI